MEKVIVKVLIFDRINEKFRSTRFKVEEIVRDSVRISGISYSRKGENLVGRVIVNISDDKKHKMGMSFPFYA